MVLFEADIVEGASEAVTQLVKQMVAFNKPDEPNTLVYRAFMSEDGEHLTFMETYSSTEAMLFHDQRFTQHFAEDLFRLTHSYRLAIYGPVSDAYKTFAAENGFVVEYNQQIKGFSR